MTKLVSAMVGIVLCAVCAIAGWWNTPGITDGGFLAITRVSTSETRATDTLPVTDSGYDYPDTDAGITERFGGSPFVLGYPLQIGVFIASVTGGWEWVELQWAYGETADSGDWNTIRRITQFDTRVDIEGCHFGLQWNPPVKNQAYLLRLIGKPSQGSLLTSSENADSIDSRGDGVTWYNHQVVAVFVRDNRKPGSR